MTDTQNTTDTTPDTARDAQVSKEVRDLRRESAGYRTRAKEAETKLAEAQAELAAFEKRDAEQAKADQLNAIETQTGIQGIGELLAGADPTDPDAVAQFTEKLYAAFESLQSRQSVSDASALTGHARPYTDPLKAALRPRRG